MIQLTVFHNDEQIKTYEVDKPIITIGRLPENDIPIASISISRRHVRMEQDATHNYILTDLNSLNGTFVNNKKVKEIQLSDGDKITIGKYCLLFEIESETSISNETPAMNIPEENSSESVNTYKTEKKDDDIEELTPHISPDENSDTATLIETNKHVVYKIDKPILSIGSSEKDDIFVEGFLITDGHVLIEKDDEGTWIHANKLMGRFKINGKKASKHKLKHKDRIEIGTSTFRYMQNGQK